MAVLLISMAHYWLWMRCWCQPIQPMSHLREGLVAMPASHRCSSNIPHTHPTLTASFSDCDQSERERVVGYWNMLCFHLIFTQNYIRLNCENPDSCIITVWFLIPCAFQYPGGNVLILICRFVSRERTFYFRAMECWIKRWFSCTNIERGFQEKQFSLHCLSKSPPKQLLLSQRASEALDQY